MARPPAIDKVLRQDQNGNPVTVADQIVQAIAAGNYFEQACGAAGIGRETAQRWLREGALAARTLRQDGTEPTGNTAKYHAFWAAVVEAEARWEVTAITTLEQLGRGGLRKVTVTEKHDKAGELVERTTRTETLPPDPSVLMWRLERKNMARYGKRVEVTNTIPDPLTRDDKAAGLADMMEAYAQGVADGTDIAEGTETAEPDIGSV